ncbi:MULTISPECIES: SRPBCC domain-containing protein [unclassified Mycolicibacterium]|uniref:SRPBCC domain-containing protein n=1 Tax=unclassified Mycolicibacterium TaxID=2636767 RepID=UPI001F4C50EA|nr:SRPBCC domain-containing protein [Mycolicibacterium sp. YH-1]UNB54189.1 SRPBCC domain-containing protein [Mycolicibacterium sp. YH-1]
MSRTDSASRVIEAPVSRVFAALTDPDALAEWLPPTGMTGSFERFDARPGGSYRLVLTYADVPASGGKTSADSDDPAFAGTMTMTWSVTRVPEGTRVDMRADDVPPGISAEDHASGMNSSLSNLAAYLTAQ